MKRFSFLIVLFLFSVAVNAQSDAVNQAFSKKYADAKSVKWTKDNGNHVVTFKHDGEKMSAQFASSGDWLSTKVNADEDDLPEAVKKAIAIQYGRFEIDIVEELHRPGQEMTYEVALDTDDLTIIAVFDQKGKKLSSKRVEE